MVKRVNINPRGNRITVGGKNINFYMENIELNDTAIIYALTHGAEVTEILRDGSLIPLTRENYNTDNTLKYEILENAYNYEQYVEELEKLRKLESESENNPPPEAVEESKEEIFDQNEESKGKETENAVESVSEQNEDPQPIETEALTEEKTETEAVTPKKTSRKKK